jgi:hypothetical protein
MEPARDFGQIISGQLDIRRGEVLNEPAVRAASAMPANDRDGSEARLPWTVASIRTWSPR